MHEKGICDTPWRTPLDSWLAREPTTETLSEFGTG